MKYGLWRNIANWAKRKGFLTIPFLCYYKKFKRQISLFGYYHMPNRYLFRDWSMTHAKISSGVQHRVYILHVLRIKDKEKKLSSKCFEKLLTWLKCHNFFATPWKFLILSNMYWGQTKRFKKWKKTDFVFCNLLLVRLWWIYNFPAFLFFCFLLFQASQQRSIH